MNAFKAEERTLYRNLITAQDLIPFSLVIKETDLLILAERHLEEEAKQAVLHYRFQLEGYIHQHPAFLTSLIPLPLDEYAPPMVQEMMRAAALAQVGPMAAVAGAIAEYVGKDLLTSTSQVVVENGGDIFLKVAQNITIGVYAGTSPLSNKLGLKITPEASPLGVCTSSGTVGHSLSFGKADAVTVVARSASLADAAATAIGNLVKEVKDIERGFAYAHSMQGILGVLIIVADKFGAWGDIELTPL